MVSPFVFIMIIIFQFALLALVLLSFLLVVAVPVVFASPNAWEENKNVVLLAASAWAGCVFVVGTLNFFVI
jgi:photosystem II PsbZ protein